MDEEIKKQVMKLVDKCRVDALLLVNRLDLINHLLRGKGIIIPDEDEETDCPIHGKIGGVNGDCPRCGGPVRHYQEDDPRKDR